jgi:hypothetical protein
VIGFLYFDLSNEMSLDFRMWFEYPLNELNFIDLQHYSFFTCNKHPLNPILDPVNDLFHANSLSLTCNTHGNFIHSWCDRFSINKMPVSFSPPDLNIPLFDQEYTIICAVTLLVDPGTPDEGTLPHIVRDGEKLALESDF